jgi:murein DD-endopeptidase MepM/ murein hydrolase activator NlpD
MFSFVQWLRPLPHAAVLALVSAGIAGCSGDTSRFNDNIFDNIFADKNAPEMTGSIQGGQGAPVGRVDSQPLPPQGAQSSYSQNSGFAGGGRGMASYAPNPAHSAASPAPSEVTGTVAASKPASTGHWTWEGGTAITVAHGDTIDSIARRYGVPASAIIATNNLGSAAALQSGQQLVIPRYNQASHTPAAAPKLASAVSAAPTGNAAVHVVAPGETLSKISRLYGKPVGEIAKANNLGANTRLNVGDRLVIPGVRSSAVKSAVPAVAEAKPAPATAPEGTEPPQSASMFAPATDTSAAGAKIADTTGALPKFRWPANGRVISGFGPMTNGQQNDGINIAVPENTPIKAAEDGVVAYAGNELKGYGNLVLVRHSNGYVTAYAHAKELLVKRGDQVKRGQVIARSGQSGNVNAPQLHFEVRKGASPLDPSKFLSGA